MFHVTCHTVSKTPGAERGDVGRTLCHSSALGCCCSERSSPDSTVVPDDAETDRERERCAVGFSVLIGDVLQSLRNVFTFCTKGSFLKQEKLWLVQPIPYDLIGEK